MSSTRTVFANQFLLCVMVIATLFAGGCASSDEGAPDGAAGVDTGSGDKSVDAAVSDGGFVISEAGTFYNDGGGGADSDIAYSVTLVSDEFVIGAGEEVYKCQDFANPFHGQQVDVIKHESHMPIGSHHVLLFFKTDATNDGLQNCSGLEAYPFQYVAQSPNFSETYPPGIGATIPTSIGFRMNMHYLNPSATAIRGQDKITMYVAKSGVVTQHAGTIFYQQTSIQIPATGSPYVSTRSCNVPQDLNLLSADSHMHQRATKFVATADPPAPGEDGGSETGSSESGALDDGSTDATVGWSGASNDAGSDAGGPDAGGQVLYETDLWADPLLKVYAPPIFLPAGSSITWSCTYVNTTGSALTFGESAATNVMCIYQGTVYPITDVTSPVVHCEK
jgi:hypothetical protein